LLPWLAHQNAIGDVLTCSIESLRHCARMLSLGTAPTGAHDHLSLM